MDGRNGAKTLKRVAEEVSAAGEESSMCTGENLSLNEFVLTESCELLPDGKQICFLLVKDGKCRYVAERASHVLNAGDWLVFSRGQGGKVSAIEKQKTTGVVFLVGLEQLSALLGAGEICLLEKVSRRLSESRHFLANSAMAQGCQALLEGAPADASLEQRSHLLRIAAAVLGEEFKLAREQNPKVGNGGGEFEVVLQRLTQEDLQNLSVAELAKKMGYSRRHLNRLFHEHMGVSISKLKLEVRLLKALFLLKNSQGKVIDVAMECGFNHLGLFSQFFKRRFAISPNEWRHQEQGRVAETLSVGMSQKDCGLASNGMCLWSNVKKNGNGRLEECGAVPNGRVCRPLVPAKSR